MLGLLANCKPSGIELDCARRMGGGGGREYTLKGIRLQAAAKKEKRVQDAARCVYVLVGVCLCRSLCAHGLDLECLLENVKT